MISIEHLSFSYGEQKALDDVNFSAADGELVALLGPNGAGKSTLFRCILKFLKGYQGSVKLDGVDVKEMSRAQIAKRIAYIPQTTVPVFNYPVIEIVLMGLTGGMHPLESPSEKHIKKAERILEELDIMDLRNRGFGRISGGERQLVLLARAMVQEARILIMDEPTANLDYGNQFRVMEKIRRLTRMGYTVILSTHNPEHALLFADVSCVLMAGRVRAAGASREVLDERLMEELYGVKVNLMDTEFQGNPARVLVPVASSETKKTGEKR